VTHIYNTFKQVVMGADNSNLSAAKETVVHEVHSIQDDEPAKDTHDLSAVSEEEPCSESSLLDSSPVFTLLNNQVWHPYITTQPKKPYTLVLDLDETLIHYNEEVHRSIQGIQFNTRPFANDFLIEMSKFFELVIFTAADQTYADEVLDKLD